MYCKQIRQLAYHSSVSPILQKAVIKRQVQLGGGVNFGLSHLADTTIGG